MLGTMIKEYMKENGIKQSYVADKMGTSPQILGTILNEKRKLEAAEFFNLCDAIGVDAANLAAVAGIYKRKSTKQETTA
ncbi:XRE family transcriptional regulator [Parablautia intestinalis]|uniref:XRE family transcriptional regulator n=1 Tax=Parablautia intestinalis TaxID=2320100 RepID=A0A3A9AS47_9FIRM|nr:helix-turn-helix transcriptional regulator [Parablautia intestinalis]RKI94330.1 XRE family transcriptional regulator [Parablautia intestinalis]